MSTFILVIILMLTVQLTNHKNAVKLNEELLRFDKKDSLIIFLCFLSSFIVNKIAKNYDFKKYWLIIGISAFVYTMVLVIVNINREQLIKRKQDQIIRVYQALVDIFGKVDIQNINYENLPFQIEEDPKLKTVSKIIIDMSLPEGRFNENSITLAQYSINKYFPELQWISNADYPKRELVFKGLPKPPKIAMFPGSDYRPASWIPLGLSGEGEVGWNIGDPKDLGMSSYITEDGKVAKDVTMPSAPQAMCLGSTGGGKAIYIDQLIEIK